MFSKRQEETKARSKSGTKKSQVLEPPAFSSIIKDQQTVWTFFKYMITIQCSELQVFCLTSSKSRDNDFQIVYFQIDIFSMKKKFLVINDGIFLFL